MLAGGNSSDDSWGLCGTPCTLPGAAWGRGVRGGSRPAPEGRPGQEEGGGFLSLRGTWTRKPLRPRLRPYTKVARVVAREAGPPVLGSHIIYCWQLWPVRWCSINSYFFRNGATMRVWDSELARPGWLCCVAVIYWQSESALRGIQSTISIAFGESSTFLCNARMITSLSPAAKLTWPAWLRLGFQVLLYIAGPCCTWLSTQT